ncbi:hypothetical protein Bca4012_066011 [Brassica carinata]
MGQKLTSGVLVGFVTYCSVVSFFWAETEQGVAQAIIRSQLNFRRDPWPKVSEDPKDLIRKMLGPDQKRRLTAQQVLRCNLFILTIWFIDDYMFI